MPKTVKANSSSVLNWTSSSDPLNPSYCLKESGLQIEKKSSCGYNTRHIQLIIKVMKGKYESDNLIKEKGSTWCILEYLYRKHQALTVLGNKCNPDLH